MVEPKSAEDAARMREERERLMNEEDWVQLTLFAGMLSFSGIIL